MCKRLADLCCLLLVCFVVAAGQERASLLPQPQSVVDKQVAPARAEILVLGVYHMANPGRDIFNSQADDVLAPKRQAEIAQLIEVLKKFRPTKIAVEADPWGPRVGQYADYLAGKYKLTRNEIDQVGYRLARELDHKSVYLVDADGEFPYPRLVNYAKASGRTKDLDAINNEFGAMVKAQNEFLASHSVMETLLYMNADDKVAVANGLYMRMAHLSEPGDWAGPDLVSDWYRRNMRIFGNIMRLVDSPNERILVIYGSGHLGWLQHNVVGDPSLVLRKLSEFTK